MNNNQKFDTYLEAYIPNFKSRLSMEEITGIKELYDISRAQQARQTALMDEAIKHAITDWSPTLEHIGAIINQTSLALMQAVTDAQEKLGIIPSTEENKKSK